LRARSFGPAFAFTYRSVYFERRWLAITAMNTQLLADLRAAREDLLAGHRASDITSQTDTNSTCEAASDDRP
jgi:hypothetical protein